MLEEHLAQSFIARLEKKAKLSKQEKEEESGEDEDSDDAGNENLAEEERDEGIVSIKLQNGVAEVIQHKMGGGEESKSRDHHQLDSQTTSTKVRNRMIKNYYYKSQANKLRCPFEFSASEVSDLCLEASKQVFGNIEDEGYILRLTKM